MPRLETEGVKTSCRTMAGKRFFSLCRKVLLKQKARAKGRGLS